MKTKELKKKILNAVHNSKRWNKFGKKELVEELLIKKLKQLIQDNYETSKKRKG